MTLDAAERHSPSSDYIHGSKPRFRFSTSYRGEPTREIVGHTGNVSLRGVLIRLPEALTAGTVCRLGRELPQASVPAGGAVIWQRSEGDKRSCQNIKLLRFVEETGRVQYRRFLSEIAAGSAA